MRVAKNKNQLEPFTVCTNIVVGLCNKPFVALLAVSEVLLSFASFPKANQTYQCTQLICS